MYFFEVVFSFFAYPAQQVALGNVQIVSVQATCFWKSAGLLEQLHPGFMQKRLYVVLAHIPQLAGVSTRFVVQFVVNVHSVHTPAHVGAHGVSWQNNVPS